MKKVLLVASVQSHICQFHRPLVDMLHRNGFEVHVAAYNNLEVKPGLKLDFVDKIIDIPFSRSIKNKNNIVAYQKIKELINSTYYDVIHCNTPIASVLTRLASQETRKKGTKIIYTAHGFQFYKGSSKKDWVLYYPIEKAMSSYTDLIFTINKEDYEVAQRFHCDNVVYIPGVGVDTARFTNAKAIDLRDELSLPEDAFIVLSVGELFPRKNHKVIIDAMTALKQYPIYYAICGNGILEDELKEQCARNSVADHVFFLGYRRDIPQVMKACNVFAFPSVREGLGLAGIEAMAAGLPVVSSNINGILDYMIENKTGHMCNPNDPNAFAKAILDFYQNSEKVSEIAKFNTEHAKMFDTRASIETIEKGYRQVLDF